MSNEERLTILEEFSRLMMQWARRAEERMDELSVAQANSEAKIAALADAQIHTDEAMARLSDRMAELAAQQAHTDQRLDALIDIVREGREGKPPQQS
jgi:chromosome segregation ATPase